MYRDGYYYRNSFNFSSFIFYAILITSFLIVLIYIFVSLSTNKKSDNKNIVNEEIINNEILNENKPEIQKDKILSLNYQDILHLTIEQKRIINELNNNKNIIVNSVAGSGKTTTILRYVLKTKKKTLIITYNRRLKDETVQKAKKMGILNYVEIHTFHSFLSNLKKKIINNDDLFRIHLKNSKLNKLIQNKLHKFETVIIDEAQDLTELYFRFIYKIITNSNNVNYMFIGDKYQCINSYKGSNPNYFLEIDKIFTKIKWINLDLNISFRLPHTIWDFFRTTDLIYPKSGKSNFDNINGYFEIILMNTSPDSIISPSLIEEIINDIKEYGASEVFIFSPSHKEPNSLGNKIANELIAKGIKIFKTSKENEFTLNETLGKVVISTIHRVKGLERKCVYLLDPSKYWEKKWAEINDSSPHNIFYVAATRHKEKLKIILSNNIKEHPSWMNEESYKFVKNKNMQFFIKTKKIQQNLIKGVKDFINELSNKEQLNFYLINKINSCYEFTSINSKNYVLKEENYAYILNCKNNNNDKCEQILEKFKINKKTLYKWNDLWTSFKQYNNNKTLTFKHFLENYFVIENISALKGKLAESLVYSDKQVKENFLNKYFWIWSNKKQISQFLNGLNYNEQMINFFLYYVQFWLSKLNKNIYKFVIENIEKIKNPNWNNRNALLLLEQSIGSNSLKEIADYLNYDIDSKFDLLTTKTTNEIINRLRSRISDNFISQIRVFDPKLELEGFVDLLDKDTNTYYEFKFKENLDKYDILQLVIYAVILNRKGKNVDNLIVWNLKDNNVIKIKIKNIIKLENSLLKAKEWEIDQSFFDVSKFYNQSSDNELQVIEKYININLANPTKKEDIDNILIDLIEDKKEEIIVEEIQLKKEQKNMNDNLDNLTNEEKDTKKENNLISTKTTYMSSYPKPLSKTYETSFWSSDITYWKNLVKKTTLLKI
ncbi:AAA family ATPase [Mycoplasma phocimorsus]|uniref:AAA family ATPase n=1 Tax=Mycoplasma phocimorsus TaxID=3045839 RepID=UPI0024BFAD05|nr:AAA family ATPase [Mycoplasma phocimorsus]MDJ1647648.1 AAA family ATPase [Mycoplasma phocimorsus]